MRRNPSSGLIGSAGVLEGYEHTPASRLPWFWLRRETTDGRMALNTEVREVLRGKPCCYALCDPRQRGTILYVGSSTVLGKEPLRAWKTIVRHLYPGAGKFESRGEFVVNDDRPIDVALWLAPRDVIPSLEAALQADYEVGKNIARAGRVTVGDEEVPF
jgi:hypothetical protein